MILVCNIFIHHPDSSKFLFLFFFFKFTEVLQLAVIHLLAIFHMVTWLIVEIFLRLKINFSVKKIKEMTET